VEHCGLDYNDVDIVRLDHSAIHRCKLEGKIRKVYELPDGKWTTNLSRTK